MNYCQIHNILHSDLTNKQSQNDLFEFAFNAMRRGVNSFCSVLLSGSREAIVRRVQVHAEPRALPQDAGDGLRSGSQASAGKRSSPAQCRGRCRGLISLCVK